MKVIVGMFSTESNEHVPNRNTIADYDVAFGPECIRKCQVGDVFAREGIEVIPAAYVRSGPSGVIAAETFRYILSLFTEKVREHISDTDGICLFLHGGSEVEGTGSGDHAILREIRKIVGPYLPIAVSCDPHGNLTREYVESCTILRSFRESPHTDSVATKKHVARLLCRLLKNRQNIHAVYSKVPIIIGGEQSVSTDEPIRTFNRILNKYEEDERLLSVSWHVGYLRHDCDCAGSGIVAVPSREEYLSYAQKCADELRDIIFEMRHQFHYTGLTMETDEAVTAALEFEGKPVFITDSGDNIGSGANGYNTVMLRIFLSLEQLDKTVLITDLNDPAAFAKACELERGQEMNMSIGVGIDDCSAKVQVEVVLQSRGIIMGMSLGDPDKVEGENLLLKVKDRPIYISLVNRRSSMCEKHQFRAAGLDWDFYDIIVVKQGYIFPDLKEKGKLSIMALTDGPTLQDTRRIEFKRIMRPMFPIDDI